MPKNNDSHNQKSFNAERDAILNAMHGLTPTSTSLLHFNPLMLHEVYKEVQTLIANNKFTLVKDNHENLTWNENYKCWEYLVKLQKPERIIRVKLLDNNSSLKQTGQDYVNRINNLAESGIDLIQKLYPKKLTEKFIKDIKESQKKLQAALQHLDPANQEQHLLAINAFQAFNSELSLILNNLNASQSCQATLKKLDYIESTHNRKCKHGMPQTIADWLKILETHEANYTASIKRDILFNVYKNPDSSENSSRNLYVINSNIPFSDIPSTLRDGTNNILPNWFRSNTKIFNINNNSLEIVDSFSAERSSSFSAIAVTKDLRNSVTQKIIENKLRNLVRNKIIEKLNQNPNTKNLDECFNQQMLVMTLLNLPFKHDQENKLPEAFSEYPQFQDSIVAFKQIKELKLTEEDINYIKNHTSVTEDQLNKLNLTSKNINHQEVFHNFASSGVRFFSREDRYNQQQLNSIIAWMQEKNYLPQKIDPKSVSKLKKYLDTNEYKYLQPDHKKALSLYIKYLELLNQGSNKPEDNFLRQTFTALLANHLGKELHVTCKSGEDRTGAVFVAIDNALCSFARIHIDPQNFNIHNKETWNKFKQDFWQNYVRTEELSASHDITNLNAIGARGLQSQSGKSISPVSNTFTVSNAMARISKLAFKKYKTTKDRNEIFDQLAPEQKPTNPLNPRSNKRA